MADCSSHSRVCHMLNSNPTRLIAALALTLKTHGSAVGSDAPWAQKVSTNFPTAVATIESAIIE